MLFTPPKTFAHRHALLSDEITCARCSRAEVTHGRHERRAVPRARTSAASTRRAHRRARRRRIPATADHAIAAVEGGAESERSAPLAWRGLSPAASCTAGGTYRGGRGSQGCSYGIFVPACLQRRQTASLGIGMLRHHAMRCSLATAAATGPAYARASLQAKGRTMMVIVCGAAAATAGTEEHWLSPQR